MSPVERFRYVGLRAAIGGTAALLAAAALAAPADAGHGAGSTTARPAQKAAVVLRATLKGSNEVPGPGDPNGSGSVTIRLHAGAGKVCAHATWMRIGTPVAAHIHKGRRGVSGAVIVDLTSAVTGGAHCVTGVPTAAIHKIARHPKTYYFNIHSVRYQAGAIRGQLHR